MPLCALTTINTQGQGLRRFILDLPFLRFQPPLSPLMAGSSSLYFSGSENVLVVPVDEFGRRAIYLLGRNYLQLLAMQRVVNSAILILSFDSRTHFDMKISRDGQVPLIKKDVKVRPEKQAIADIIRSCMRVWFDVSGLQDRKRMLSGNRTATLVSFGHKNPKCALTKTCACKVFRSV